MLITPTKGFLRSITVQNVKLDALCDWIEGTVLFDEPELSKIDVVDRLLEELIYEEQDLANEMVMSAWIELKRRYCWIGDNSALRIEKDWIKRNVSVWQEAPAYAFLILLSLAQLYDWWSREFGQDYNEQGNLFEKLTKESFEAQFDQWRIYQTGWSPTNTSSLQNVVREVAGHLGERVNEEGLSLFCTSGTKEL